MDEVNYIEFNRKKQILGNLEQHTELFNVISGKPTVEECKAIEILFAVLINKVINSDTVCLEQGARNGWGRNAYHFCHNEIYSPGSFINQRRGFNF